MQKTIAICKKAVDAEVNKNKRGESKMRKFYALTTDKKWPRAFSFRSKKERDLFVEGYSGKALTRRALIAEMTEYHQCSSAQAAEWVDWREFEFDSGDNILVHCGSVKPLHTRSMMCES